VAFLAFVALAAAGRYQPVAPIAGSYSWTMSVDGSVKNYLGGRVIYDYVAGYTRLESWDSAAPNPGINGISIWDLRGAKAVLTYIGPKLECMMQEVPADDPSVPSPDDFSAHRFDSLSYWNRALAEKWIDADMNYIYLDVFTREVVGMGTARDPQDPDDQAIDYHVVDWSDEAPDGAEFRLPGTVKCEWVNASGTPPMDPSFLARAVAVEQKKRIFGIHGKKWHTCHNCVKGMQHLYDLACGPKATEAGRMQACKQYMPNLQFCSTILATACAEGAIHPKVMCKQNGSC
jgi:hypothetical protein